MLITSQVDTIAGIATPPGKSGIGIIRISGPQTPEILRQILISNRNIPEGYSGKSRKLIHAFIINSEKEKIDEVLVGIMPASRAYTGEMTAEINCHGGRAVLIKILELLIGAGARMAEPGEFTKRAVLNGRIDLVQAEAINDLINARTEKSRKIAWQQMQGGLSERFENLKKNLTDNLIYLEAAIDIEMSGSVNMEKVNDNLLESTKKINQMLGSAKSRKYLFKECWVIICGPPNVGKSSIFNNILKTERSLVCNLPGTTRDHISESIEINGIEVRFTDTAGIRDTEDIIEKSAIKKSLQQISSADIKVFVLDQSKDLEEKDKEFAIKTIKEGGIVLLNKSDLSTHSSVEEYIVNNKDKSIIKISALTDEGMELFLDLLENKINENFINDEKIITNLRQIKLLETAEKSVQTAIEMIKNNTKTKELDLLSYEIKTAINSLEEILGGITNDEILNSIFNKFCVGK